MLVRFAVLAWACRAGREVASFDAVANEHDAGDSHGDVPAAGRGRLPPFIDEFFALMKSQRFSEAELLALRVVARKPDHYIGYSLLGTALRFQHQLEEAEIHLKRAIELWTQLEPTPDNPHAYLQIGLLYQEQGKLDEALEALRRSAQAAPDLLDAHAALAELLKQMSRRAEALDVTRGALERFPTEAKLHVLLGELLGETSQTEEAEQAFQTADGLAPHWALPVYDLAVLHIQQRRYREAEEFLREAIRREPQNQDYRSLLRAVMAWADWGTPAGASIWTRPRFRLRMKDFPARDTVVYDRAEVERVVLRNLEDWRIVSERLTQVSAEQGDLFFRGQVRDYRGEGGLSLEPALLRETRTHHEVQEAIAAWRKALAPFLGPLAEGSAGALVYKSGTSMAYVHPPPFDVTGRLLELVYEPELGGTMQHYGFPTDYLDVSRDPRVALWFALHCAREDAAGIVHYSRHRWSGRESMDNWPSVYVIYLPRWQTVDLTDGCIAQFASQRVVRQRAALASCLLYDDPKLKPLPGLMVHGQVQERWPPVGLILKLDPAGDWAQAELPAVAWYFPSDDPIYQGLLGAAVEFLRRYSGEAARRCAGHGN